MERIKYFIAVGFITLLLSCSTQSNSEEEAMLVFAASSLTDVLTELIDTFEVAYNVSINLNAASSGTLARQIAQGGSPDVFISANVGWADYIDSLGLFHPGFKSEVARNRLALVVPKGVRGKRTIDSLSWLKKELANERISIGDPAHVPAGKYAKQALQYYGIYDSINHAILPAKDVRSALLVVELGECPYGVVYQTDASRSEKVSVLETFPEEAHDPVVYVAGLCKLNTNSKLFFSYIQSEEARAIWYKYGFQ